MSQPSPLNDVLKLDSAGGTAQAPEAVVANLQIRAAGGGLPTQDVGHAWSLEAVDAATGIRPAGVQWAFAPWPFISFAASTQVGGVVNLEQRDLDDNPISFACQAATTQVYAAAPGYAGANQIINSRSPVANGQSLVTRPVVMTDGGRTWLRLGPPNEVGIEIDVDTVANGTAGLIGAIQLVNSTRIATLNTGRTETRTTGGAWALDVADGQNTFIYLGRTVPVGNALQISDSPAQELGPPLVRMQVNEYFRTFIMFQSNTPNANWMPLYLVSWGWTATAVYQSGAWQLASGAAVGPDEGPTLSFPYWQTNIREYQWT